MPRLKPYDDYTNTRIFAHIDKVVNKLHSIIEDEDPCQRCIYTLLRCIRDSLDILLNYGPSMEIAKERADFERLNKLSRQLLKIDTVAFTHAIWVLLDRKMNSLDCSNPKWPTEPASREYTVLRDEARRRQQAQAVGLDIIERYAGLDSAAPRPPGSESPGSESPGSESPNL